MDDYIKELKVTESYLPFLETLHSPVFWAKEKVLYKAINPNLRIKSLEMLIIVKIHEFYLLSK